MFQSSPFPDSEDSFDPLERPAAREAGSATPPPLPSCHACPPDLVGEAEAGLLPERTVPVELAAE